MQKILALFAFSLLLVSCGPTVDLNFNPDPISKSREIDTVYATMSDLIKDSRHYDTLQSFLRLQRWRTVYDYHYLVQSPSDTLFREILLPGQEWIFGFTSFSSPFGSGYENYGQLQAPNHFGEFVLNDTSITLGNGSDKRIFYFYNPTRYKDSTFSFSLKNVEMQDTLQEIMDIKLQSF